MVNFTKKNFFETQIIGAALGVGALLTDTALGAEVLGIKNIVQTLGIAEQRALTRDKSAVKFLLDFYNKLAQVVAKSLDDKKLPIVVGGDHSIAIANWSTVVTKLQASDDFGLIWLDAHLDAHIYETSPSKAFHGMPVAHLLGFGESEFAKFLSPQRKINPKYLVYIGARSYEREEKILLERLGVRIITMDELDKRGFAECIKEALAIAGQASKGFGLSIDIDFFDPKYAPGIGSPVSGGPNPDLIIPYLDLLDNPALKAIEIAEFNPTLDRDNLTHDLCLKLLAKFQRTI